MCKIVAHVCTPSDICHQTTSTHLLPRSYDGNPICAGPRNWTILKIINIAQQQSPEILLQISNHPHTMQMPKRRRERQKRINVLLIILYLNKNIVMDIVYHWMMACNRRPCVPLTRRRRTSPRSVEMQIATRWEKFCASSFPSSISLPTHIA